MDHKVDLEFLMGTEPTLRTKQQLNLKALVLLSLKISRVRQGALEKHADSVVLGSPLAWPTNLACT